MNRSQWFAVLRTIFSLALAGWAINMVISNSGANLTQEFLNCHKGWLAVAVLLTAVGTLLSAYRWGKLLALQGVRISLWDAFRLTMVGVFFNLFGLGGVGGDLFKMMYIQSHAGDRRAEAVLSILVDRILGLLGLFVVALISLPFMWAELQTASSVVKSLVASVIAIAVTGGLGVTLVLARDLWLPAGLKERIRGLGAHFPAKLVGIVAKVIRSLDLYRSQVGELFKALAVSAVIHTVATLSVISIGQSFRVEGLAPRHYFLAVQVANTISAVPVTPGGLGSRDLVLAKFFEIASSDSRAKLIPGVFSGILVFWSLVGGIFFMFERPKATVTVEEEEVHEEAAVGLSPVSVGV